MTSAERNEVRRVAQASLDAHANCRRPTDGPCTCGDCAGWRAILCYVPTGTTDAQHVVDLTSPPAARPVFAGVSVEELARVFWCATGRGYKPEQWETLAPSTQAEWIKGIRAVLDRLEVSLVAPVDPEEVARDFYIRLSKLTGSLQFDGDRRDRIETMRATLIARGIPVTPERGQ